MKTLNYYNNSKKGYSMRAEWLDQNTLKLTPGEIAGTGYFNQNETWHYTVILTNKGPKLYKCTLGEKARKFPKIQKYILEIIKDME